MSFTSFLDEIGKAAGFKLTLKQSQEQRRCVSCAKPFSKENIRSDIERRESEISGICGICFEKIFDKE